LIFLSNFKLMTLNSFSSKDLINQEFTAVITSSRIPRVIAGAIRRYGLLGQCDVEEVISEAYFRTIHAIELGKKILNLEAWILVTSKHIILEKSRSKLKKLSREISLDAVDILVDESDRSLDDDFFESISTLKTVLNNLPEKDHLIVIRRMEGISWQKIQSELSDKGYVESLENLRKRYGRIISRLRSDYEKKRMLENDMVQSTAVRSDQLILLEGEDKLPGIIYKNEVYVEQEQQELIQEIKAEISKLNPLDQKIFLLRSEGKSFSEIVAQLVKDGDYFHSDSLQNTITQRFNRIKKKIREKVRS
jgi:DNA-directed RNA polymerase specialized sigma24 family protein